MKPGCRSLSFLSFVWTILLCLFLFLGYLFTGHDGHFLSLNCIGSSGFCGQTPPVPANAPQAVATANAITSQQPAVVTSLKQQDSYRWPVDNNCKFHDNAYYVQYNGSSNGTYTCVSPRITAGNFAIAADVTLFSGDSAGILFRGDQGMNNFYEFMISQQQFVFAAFINNTATQLAPALPSTVLHPEGQANRLQVIVKGNDFKLFINSSFVAEVHDSSITNPGYIGFGLAYDPHGKASFANLDMYNV